MDHRSVIIASSRGYTITELIFSVAFLSLVLFVVIMIIDPIERVYNKRDERLAQDARMSLDAIEKYYDQNGRLPWKDLTGSSNILPRLPWTPYSATEIGICKDSQCSKPGLLIGKYLDSDFYKNKSVISDSWLETVYIGRGKNSEGKTYACYIPYSQAERQKEANLFKVSPGSQLPLSGKPEYCGIGATWEEDDLCFVCMTAPNSKL